MGQSKRGKTIERKSFGIILKKAREASRQSQAELAKRLKLNRTFISFIERGLRQPTLSTILALGQGLGIRASALVQSVERMLKL